MRGSTSPGTCPEPRSERSTDHATTRIAAAAFYHDTQAVTPTEATDEGRTHHCIALRASRCASRGCPA